MAIFGYSRVSKAEQTTENQRLEIERAGYAVEFWFSDVVSGSSHASQREHFKTLLIQIRRGDTLVVSKLDRLGRDTQDVLATISLLAERKVEIIVLQLGKLDLASPAGKLMLTMLAAVAAMERDLLIERTYAGLLRARSQGKVLGRPFKTTPKQRADMKAMHQSGLSISALAKINGVSRATVAQIVKPTP